MTPRQLVLALPFAPSHASADLIPDASNREALTWLARPEAWPSGRFCLFGPAGVGKSHMLRIVADADGWTSLDVADLRGVPAAAGQGVVLDNADCAGDEAALFHLINLCAQNSIKLLLAGQAPPARWPVALPDLASRLRATAAAGIEAPSDALLAALLAKLFADRQLRVPPEVQAWLLARLHRAAPALIEAVARLDRAALAARGAVTRPLARAALMGWEGFSPADDGEEAPSPDVSPAAGPLL